MVAAKQAAFAAKRDRHPHRRRSTPPDPTLADRLARCAGVLPVSAFDAEPFAFTDLEDRVVAYWSDLQALLTAARDDVDERIGAAAKAA